MTNQKPRNAKRLFTFESDIVSVLPLFIKSYPVKSIDTTPFLCFRYLVLAVSFLAPVLLSACATGPKFAAITETPNNEAIVYVYRPRIFSGDGTGWTLKANGMKIAKMSSGTYHPYLTKERGLSFSVNAVPNVFQLLFPWMFVYSLLDPDKDLMLLDVEPGRVYYLKAKLYFGGRELIRVNDTTGMDEIRECTKAKELK